MSPPDILVVIPVLNEEPALNRLLPDLRAQSPALDLVVVDGGSTDASRAVAARWEVPVLKCASAGRAAQMNAGAHYGNHAVLLFLHADTRLPPGAAAAVTAAARGGCTGGAFARRFDNDSALLRLTCRMADWRGRRFGWFLGDQAIFVRRDVYAQLGGFPEWPLFEDLEFSRRMARVGSTRLLTPPVVSSARRFEKTGPLRRTTRDFVLTLRYLAGKRW